MQPSRVYSKRVSSIPTSLKYRSGEEIRKWDLVLFHGEPAQIELVAWEPGGKIDPRLK
jgi:hypothetical protein